MEGRTLLATALLGAEFSVEIGDRGGMVPVMTASVLWFRRDLRLSDHQALRLACRSSDEVLALFVLDPTLLEPAGLPRRAFLFGCLRSLDESIGGRLVVRTGDPVQVVSDVAKEVDATEVYCTEDFGPYGRRRDDAVEEALSAHDVSLVRVDSPYAVEPGALTTKDGNSFKVFGAYLRAWRSHGYGKPIAKPRSVRWTESKSEDIPPAPDLDVSLPVPGESAGLRRATSFFDSRIGDYPELRDIPSAGGTSRLSPYLKYGCLHPRQLLHRLERGAGDEKFRSELCWRDFYADVLFANPSSRDRSLVEKMASMKLDSGKQAEERFRAWAEGRTGYPIVDAGMRQLLGEGWMHNRARMIVASFLVKDLHIDWRRGAHWFMQHLVDGDLASNTHGWQWVAGTGTDAAPYFRIFNPITQGKKFDPDGSYVRKWVPELADVDTRYIHEPWGHIDSYPDPIVDHADERAEALRRYADLG